MEQVQSNKIKKLKLDFKDSKYSTGRRKKSIAKVWVKKDLVKFTLMEKLWQTILKDLFIN